MRGVEGPRRCWLADVIQSFLATGDKEIKTHKLRAWSKDLEGTYLAHAVRAFATAEAREQDLPAVRT
jgi:hypothetical protein